MEKVVQGLESTDFVPVVESMALGDKRTLTCSHNETDVDIKWCFITIEKGMHTFEAGTETIEVSATNDCPDFSNTNDAVLPVCNETLVFCISEGMCTNDKYTSLLSRPYFILFPSEQAPCNCSETPPDDCLTIEDCLKKCEDCKLPEICSRDNATERQSVEECIVETCCKMDSQHKPSGSAIPSLIAAVFIAILLALVGAIV